MDTRLQVTSTTCDGCAVVTAAGEVDMSTAEQLASAITRATVPGATLIVDLSAITFMDSAGLHVVLAGNHNAAACDASLVFTPSPAVVRLFEMSGADRVLVVRPLSA